MFVCLKFQIAILEIDIQGGEKIYNKHNDWNFVFLHPPALEDIEKRLRNR
jgi:guanylate kinase